MKRVSEFLKAMTFFTELHAVEAANGGLHMFIRGRMRSKAVPTESLGM